MYQSHATTAYKTCLFFHAIAFELEKLTFYSPRKFYSATLEITETKLPLK